MSSSIVSDEMKARTGQQLEALKPLKDAPSAMDSDCALHVF